MSEPGGSTPRTWRWTWRRAPIRRCGAGRPAISPVNSAESRCQFDVCRRAAPRRSSTFCRHKFRRQNRTQVNADTSPDRRIFSSARTSATIAGEGVERTIRRDGPLPWSGGPVLTSALPAGPPPHVFTMNPPDGRPSAEVAPRRRALLPSALVRAVDRVGGPPTVESYHRGPGYPGVPATGEIRCYRSTERVIRPRPVIRSMTAATRSLSKMNSIAENAATAERYRR